MMGVARLESLVQTLCDKDSMERREEATYPSYLPIAIIERASMPDQRVISSTLGDVCQAMEQVGEHRPPGMIVIGWAVLALFGDGDIDVLELASSSNLGAEIPENDHREPGIEENVDAIRSTRWLKGHKWHVEEGLPEGWSEFEAALGKVE